ncbi:hypothetical protein NA56DRAFT_696855 [Hyaloscypha hepaticicola]|uniref:Uncharacterized protein n=1 Tax=Hyaloscypha hepaticicola TaxID=2082293 RepID=A0A2J6QNJ1_9HELO|nr:hypothetical protein NA56DRAFT_696855 [Hyaloscypha hepaticicola]
MERQIHQTTLYHLPDGNVPIGHLTCPTLSATAKEGIKDGRRKLNEEVDCKLGAMGKLEARIPTSLATVLLSRERADAWNDERLKVRDLAFEKLGRVITKGVKESMRT